MPTFSSTGPTATRALTQRGSESPKKKQSKSAIRSGVNTSPKKNGFPTSRGKFQMRMRSHSRISKPKLTYRHSRRSSSHNHKYSNHSHRNRNHVRFQYSTNLLPRRLQVRDKNCKVRKLIMQLCLQQTPNLSGPNNHIALRHLMSSSPRCNKRSGQSARLRASRYYPSQS